MGRMWKNIIYKIKWAHLPSTHESLKEVPLNLYIKGVGKRDSTN